MTSYARMSKIILKALLWDTMITRTIPNWSMPGNIWENRLKGTKLQFSAIGLSGIIGVNSMGIPRTLVPTHTRMELPDLTYPKAPCQRPLIRMIMRHNSKVGNCCTDTSGAFKLGNMHQQWLKEVWFSDHHVQVVRDLAEGHREKYALCRNCLLSPSIPVKSSAKLPSLPAISFSQRQGKFRWPA